MSRVLVRHCFAVAALIACAVALAAGDPMVALEASPIVAKPVESWTPLDVEYWMNYTIGYTEYSKIVRKHLIDGVTLLSMTRDDWEEHFPLKNTLHSLKLKAHTEFLRTKCACKDTTSDDLWSYLRHENFRAWVVGAAALFAPRTAMLYVYFFDAELLELVAGSLPTLEEVALSTSVHRTVNWVATSAYWICLLLCPNVYLFFQMCRIFGSNYLVVPFFLVHFAVEQNAEAMLIWQIFVGKATSLRDALAAWLWHYTMLVPVVAFFTWFFIPLVVQQVCVFAFLALNSLNFVYLIGVVLRVFAQTPEEPARK